MHRAAMHSGELGPDGFPLSGDSMRLAVFAVAAFATLAALAQAQPPSADDGQWVMPAKNHESTRYSPLKDIDTSNAGQLKLAFSMPTGLLRGHEAATIVADYTMFI